MRKLVSIVLLALALAVVVGCSSGDDEGAGGSAGGGEMVEVQEGPASGGRSSAKGTLGDSAGDSQLVGDSVPQVGPQVVKTASLSLAAERGEFDVVIEEVGAITAGLGGFVVSSSASQGSERRLVRGTIVVRVPARSYDDAVGALAGLGKVESRTESGQDVSQEFVDLGARIRQLQAVENQLLELLDRANSVAAALAVQRQLSQVQLELERARGRLQYLEDRVAFATVSLEIHEQALVAPKKDEDGFGIVEAWRKAGQGFLAVIGWTLVVLATAAPIVLLLAIALLLGRLALRRFSWPARRPV